MTKKIIKLLIVGVMAISILSGCNSTITLTETETEKKTGAYEIYYTNSDEDYLNFLNEFDDEKYEIVDISHSQHTWLVTYQIK